MISSMQWMHRDIKPMNIRLDVDGKMVCANFSIANDFSNGDVTHVLFGTPKYHSLQVVHGKLYSSKTNVYLLGCIVQSMLYRSVSFFSVLVVRRTHAIGQAFIRTGVAAQVLQDQWAPTLGMFYHAL